MCGIFGYSGDKNASDIIREGLKRLEYRGYDSWGIAVNSNKGDIEVFKTTKGLTEDSVKVDLTTSHTGIGHTRWATHGGVNETNAHPHFSIDKSFILAQNGIVENFQELKKSLQKKGHKFKTETDTEVIVRLIEEERKKEKNLVDATQKAFLKLEGRNTIILLEEGKNHIIAIRNGSPLVIGVGDKEYFFASDTLSFADKTNKVIFMNDYDMVEFLDDETTLKNVKTNQKLNYIINVLDQSDVKVDKGEFDSFMLKEIVEQKYTIKNGIQYSEEELEPLIKAIKRARTVYTVGAGTASYEAGQIAYYLRAFGGINAIELKAYEMNSFKEIFNDEDLIIGISQSGETADTIEALEFAKKKGAKIASIVNMVGSTITRMSDYPYFARSGPEICVCSTKAFTAKVAWGLLVSLTLSNRYDVAKKSISELSESLEHYFNDKLFKQLKSLSKKFVKNEHFFVLGKGQNYYIALESALKIKEISYKHFEGFAAGELKHGVIALIEKGTPVFILISNDENKSDMINAAAEVKARGAFVIGVGQVNNDLFDEYIETIAAGFASAIVNVIPFQLLSYFMAKDLKLNPDKPRNLAKSVTVK